MKKSIIISGIIWLCIILMVWVYAILSNSTVEMKTTKVNIDWTPIKKEEVKTEKEVKKETKKDNDNNTQYVIHTTEANVITGEVGYWIFNLNWEKIKDLKEVYSLTTTDKSGYENVKSIIINDWENSYIFDNIFKLLWKINLKNYWEKSVTQIFWNKIDNNVYFQTKTNDYNSYNLLQDSKWNIFDENFDEFITFLWNWHLLVKIKGWIKYMALTSDLKPVLKSSFDNVSEYNHTYKWQKVLFYKIELNGQNYLYYDNNWIFETINWFPQWIWNNTNIYLIEDKLYILDDGDNDKYYSYDLKIDESNKLQIWAQKIVKIWFDINSINLDWNWKIYTSKKLKWLWEYNWQKIYEYSFSYTTRSCSLWWWCNNYSESDTKVLNYNWQEIKQNLEKYLYNGSNYKWFFTIRDINLAIQKSNIDRYDPDNINVLNKSNNLWVWANYINLYNKNTLPIKFDKTYTLNWVDFSIMETPNGAYIKNKNNGEISNTFSEIKAFYKNENIFSIITSDNKNCLYKENNWKFEEYYCSNKEILWYKDWYILEWTWYSWDFWELTKENWVVKFKKIDFLDKSWKKIIVSEFNSNPGNILFIDNQNNFYLFEYINTNGVDLNFILTWKKVKKLIFSWKRIWHDDLEIFIVNQWIIDSILKK